MFSCVFCLCAEIYWNANTVGKIRSWIHLSACNMYDGCRWLPSLCPGDRLWPLCRTLVTSSPGGHHAPPRASLVGRRPESGGTLHPGVPVNRGRRSLRIRTGICDEGTRWLSYWGPVSEVIEWGSCPQEALWKCLSTTSTPSPPSYFLIRNWDFDVFCSCVWWIVELITMF